MNMHKKSCLKSFINREIQISMSVKCLFTPTLVTLIEEKHLRIMVEACKPSHLGT